MPINVTVDFSTITHTLPSNFTATRFFGPGDSTITMQTSDGRTLAQLIADAGIRSCPWDVKLFTGSNSWGTTTLPSSYVQYGTAIQDAVVAAGGGWALKMNMGPLGTGRTAGDPAASPAATPTNVASTANDTTVGTPVSPDATKTWAQWAAARWTAGKCVAGIGDNEWTSRIPGGYYPYWYTQGGPYFGANSMDWGYCHWRYWATKWNEVVSAPFYGFDYLSGSTDTPNAGSDYLYPQLARWLSGTLMSSVAWSGGTYSWPHGSDGNAHYGGTALHGYGHSVGSPPSVTSARTPTQVASDLNAVVSQYETNVNYLRTLVPSSHPYAQEEWWIAGRDNSTSDTVSYSREALGHLLGFISHAKNQAAWNCQFLTFWGVGPKIVNNGPSSPESWIMVQSGQLKRMPSYYAIKDMASHAANNYPAIVTSSASSGKVVAGRVTSGDICYALVANVSANTETLNVTGFTTITKVTRLPNSHAIETVLPTTSTLPATIAPLEVLYIEGTFAGSPPPGGGGSTEMAHYYKSDATTRTSTSTSASEVTNYTISWANLTDAGFVAGDVALVLVFGQLAGGDFTNTFNFQVGHGTTYAGRTDWSESKFIQKPYGNSTSEDSGHGGFPCAFMEKHTLVDSENLYCSLWCTTAATTAAFDSLQVLIINLSDLATDDWRYDETTPAGDAPTTYGTTGGTITLPAASGSDWLILSAQHWLMDSNSATSQHALQYDGTDYGEISNSADNTGEEQTSVVARYVAAAGVSKVARSRFKASSLHDCNSSKIFALRLSAFVDHDGSQSASTVTLSAVDTWYEFAGFPTFTPTDAGDVVVFGFTRANYADNLNKQRARTQVDGVDWPTASLQNRTYRSKQTPSGVLEIPMVGVANMTASAKDIDMDVAEDEDVTPNYTNTYHTAAVFSTKLPAAAGGGTAAEEFLLLLSA